MTQPVPMRGNYLETESAVIGGGLAGCTVALELADAGHTVDLFVKGQMSRDSNSFFLAGGLAAVPMIRNRPISGDSFGRHIKETLAAGKGLNHPGVVEFCSKRFFPDVIEWLAQNGVCFDESKNGFRYDLHREGGHSKNRIFHIKDTTGVSIMGVLVHRVLSHPRIRVHEDHVAIDLITKNKVEHTRRQDVCLGAYLYDVQADRVITVASQGVFIATGGLGKVFLYTTNPDVATGDGLAMCYRAGLPLANMEFIQFHPSVFYDANAADEGERRFLLTEALRGAGAILKLQRDDSKDFVLRHHPLGSNATRDVVTRAQDIEMRRHGLKHVWLDCTAISKKKILKDFRSSYEYCKSKGFDMTSESIPIIYAAHYSNGGVLVGRHGETAMRGCYVLGEASYTGLHGATRLASNSGPECVLYGRLAARHFLAHTDFAQNIPKVPLWRVGEATSLRDKTTVAYYWDTIRRTMTGLCGISRNAERLQAAREVLSSIKKNIRDFYWNYRVSRDFLEVRNIAHVASIIIESALIRKESRGCHSREDFLRQDNRHFQKITIVQKSKPVSMERIEQKILKSL
jgi:L-aspartate oxidase